MALGALGMRLLQVFCFGVCISTSLAAGGVGTGRSEYELRQYGVRSTYYGAGLRDSH